jgi:stage III sporulation protein AH
MKDGGYSMNKKQIGIVITLLALIVVAGIAATKLQSPLYVNTDSGETISLNNTESASTYFAETKLTREQTREQTLQYLKTMTDDKNAPDESRKAAGAKYNNIASEKTNEGKIEAQVKAKGFADAICFFEDSKVKVIVKSSKDLTAKETAQIKDIVMNVSKISDVEIECKE